MKKIEDIILFRGIVSVREVNPGSLFEGFAFLGIICKGVVVVSLNGPFLRTVFKHFFGHFIDILHDLILLY